MVAWDAKARVWVLSGTRKAPEFSRLLTRGSQRGNTTLHANRNTLNLIRSYDIVTLDNGIVCHSCYRGDGYVLLLLKKLHSLKRFVRTTVAASTTKTTKIKKGDIT